MHYHVRKYLLPKGERHPVDCITAEKMNEWIGEPELRHLSPMSLKHIVATLCLILGRQFGRKKIHYPAVTGEQEEAVCYSPEEMRQIVDAAEGMWKFATAAETGMRAGELYALEVPDINFARNIIHVRRAVWEGQKQSTKSRNANRAIDVQPELLAMLKHYLNGPHRRFGVPCEERKPTSQQ